ncbi:MAG: hypothetical protein GVY35_01665 [Bacteroidetes bacterium]|jgi:uncharacterized protein YfiM (DUF2279 family)|nr:hypothetical protein [Bacteroidota bacterium]
MSEIASTLPGRFAVVATVLLLSAAGPTTAQPTVPAAVSPPAPYVALYSPAPHLHAPPPRSTDRWLARDKLQHLTFSFLWTLSAQYVLVDKADWSNRAALPVAAGSSAAVGLSKELFDWRAGPTGRFSPRDLTANAVGIALAVGVILL